MLTASIQSNFSRAAKSYQNHAKVQFEIGQRLCQRLDYYKIEPMTVLDLGAGPGPFSYLLKQRFPKARVIALDISESMLKVIPRRWRYKLDKVAASMAELPFKTGSMDIIFANQVIHWHQDSLGLFKELRRVLKPGGVFLFSTLGPDTFKELKQAWQQIDDHSHVNEFVDMHIVGDALVQAGFIEPVVDMEYLIARYPSVMVLARDLKAQGVQHHGTQARKGLTSRRQWHQLEQKYDLMRDDDGLLPLTYEVIYGQAWGRELNQPQAKSSNEVSVPLSQILSKR